MPGIAKNKTLDWRSHSKKKLREDYREIIKTAYLPIGNVSYSEMVLQREKN